MEFACHSCGLNSSQFQSEAPVLVWLQAQLAREEGRTSKPSAGEGLGMTLSVRS